MSLIIRTCATLVGLFCVAFALCGYLVIAPRGGVRLSILEGAALGGGALIALTWYWTYIAERLRRSSE